MDGTACYVTVTTIEPYAVRTIEGLSVTVNSATTWIDKDTSEPIKQVIQMSVDVKGEWVDATATITYVYDYPPEGKWPLEVGKEWSYLRTVTLDPLLIPVQSDPWDVEVWELEEVTVAAGTFNCFKIVHYDAGGLDIWYSEVVKNAVKKMDWFVSYDEPETWELVSYSIEQP